MSKLGSLYIRLGEPEGPLCGGCCEIDDWAADEIARLRAERDALAAQNQQMRVALQACQNYFHFVYMSDVEEAPSIPDLATPAINRSKAEALREAATKLHELSGEWGDREEAYGIAIAVKVLRARADELEGKEAGL